MVESNELVKKDLNIERDDKPLEKQKKIFNQLVEERSFEFRNLEKRINRDNLIDKYETKKRSPKDFIKYQNPIDLFKDLKDLKI